MKNSLLQNLPSFKNQGKTTVEIKPGLSKAENKKSPENTQAKFESMQNIQRASGRRGN